MWGTGSEQNCYRLWDSVRFVGLNFHHQSGVWQVYVLHHHLLDHLNYLELAFSLVRYSVCCKMIGQRHVSDRV